MAPTETNAVIWLGEDCSLLNAAWSLYEVHHVRSAQAAIRGLQHNIAPCVVIDLALPGVDVGNLLHIIQSQWPHVGILAVIDVPPDLPVTAKPYPEVDRYLSCHADTDALVLAVRSLVPRSGLPSDTDYDTLQERARHLEELARASITLSSAQDPRSILDDMRLIAHSAVDADDLAVLLVSEDYTTLSDVFELGAPAPYIEVCQNHLQTLSEEERRRYIGEEVLLRERIPSLLPTVMRVREAEAGGAWSYMRLPLNDGQRVIGFVALFAQQSGQFDGAHLQLGRMFAAQLGIAVRNVRLYLRLNQAEQRQETVSRVARLIAEDLALDAVLQRLVEEAARLSVADHGLVVLNQPDHSLAIRAVYNLPPELIGYKLEPGAGQVESVALSGQPAIVTDYDNWPHANPALRGRLSPGSTLFSVPLVYRGLVLGVLQIIRQQAAPGDVQDVQAMLMTLAPSVATAVAKAQLHETVRRDQQRLRAILAHTPAAVIVCDVAGHLQLVNPAAERLIAQLGLSLDGVKDRSVLDVALELVPQSADTLRLVRNTLELSLGKVGEFVVHIAPITSLEGKIDGYVGVAQDVTELRSIDRMKSNLNRVLTHDLGNLLMLARSPLEMLDEPDLPAEQREALKRMLTGSLERMEALVRDVMDLEMAGSLAPATMVPYQLTALIQQAIRRNQARAEPRQIALNYQERKKPPRTMKGHSVLILEAIDNLVSNAVKYTPDGGHVDVVCDVRNGEALIQVKDSGYGIPEDKLDMIFEPFFRVRDARTSHIQGTGLGLSLVKAFVEAHSGRVTVESKIDTGSEFTIHLPVHAEASLASRNQLLRVDLSAFVDALPASSGEVVPAQD